MLMRFLSMNPNVNALSGEAHFFDEEQSFYRGLKFYNAVLPKRIPGKVSSIWWRHDMNTLDVMTWTQAWLAFSGIN